MLVSFKYQHFFKTACFWITPIDYSLSPSTSSSSSSVGIHDQSIIDAKDDDNEHVVLTLVNINIMTMWQWIDGNDRNVFGGYVPGRALNDNRNIYRCHERLYDQYFSHLRRKLMSLFVAVSGNQSAFSNACLYGNSKRLLFPAATGCIWKIKDLVVAQGDMLFVYCHMGALRIASTRNWR